jgi:hypothetical protein
MPLFKTLYLLCSKQTVIALLLLIQCRAVAQSAYHGGKGGGFAMASTNLIHIDKNGQIGAADNSIYPNPLVTGGSLFINFKDIPTKPVVLELMDISGRLCYKDIILLVSNITTLPLSNIAQGMYFLKLANANEVSVTKLIVLGH